MKLTWMLDRRQSNMIDKRSASFRMDLLAVFLLAPLHVFALVGKMISIFLPIMSDTMCWQIFIIDKR